MESVIDPWLHSGIHTWITGGIFHDKITSFTFSVAFTTFTSTFAILAWVTQWRNHRIAYFTEFIRPIRIDEWGSESERYWNWSDYEIAICLMSFDRIVGDGQHRVPIDHSELFDGWFPHDSVALRRQGLIIPVAPCEPVHMLIAIGDKSER